MTASGLLADLAQALLDEERARSEVRAALRRQADLLRQLRALGVPATRVAHRVAASRGVALAIADRQRLAERLRKRAWRGTPRPGDLACSGGLPPIPASPSDRAIAPTTKEITMATLKRRTITEEYVEDEAKDTEAEEDEEQEEVEEEDGDDEPAPSSRKR